MRDHEQGETPVSSSDNHAMVPVDPFDGGEQPRCDRCGTVMRDADGGYSCGGCGHFVDTPWVERPHGGDHLPSVG